MSEPKNISISKVETTKQEDNTFDNQIMPPVESSPRLDDELKETDQNRMTFFNVVKNINNSP